MITSTQNQHVKHLLALQQKSSLRNVEGLFVIEGQRELSHCLHAGYKIETLFVCTELTDIDALKQNVGIPGGTSKEPTFIEVSSEVYKRMAYRGSTEGVIAIMKANQHRLEDLKLKDNPLIIVLESIEKPGNLGAILRTADAAKVDAVIICNPLTDLYNPNLIRASIGALFTVPTATCSTEDCIRFLQKRNINILTAQLQDSRPYYDTPMKVPTAIVMGTESTGLSQLWRDAATAHIRIPMLGKLDSLNVSVSAAILTFEAVRQRMEMAYHS